jgi:hypothetical protein
VIGNGCKRVGKFLFVVRGTVAAPQAQGEGVAIDGVAAEIPGFLEAKAVETGWGGNNEVAHTAIGVAGGHADPLELDLVNIAAIGLGKDEIVGVELVDIGKLKARHFFLMILFCFGLFSIK